MPTVRVVVVDLPRMLSDIIGRVVESEAGFELVGHARGEEELTALLEGAATDVVVLGSSGDELPDLGRQLLRQHPRLRILTVAGDGRHAFLYQLSPLRKPLGELSPRRLIRALQAGEDEL